MKKKLRIAINAQIPPLSGAGGIETVLRILTSLNKFGDEEYIFITHWSEPDWIKPLLGDRQTTVRAPRAEQLYKPHKKEAFKRLLGPLRPIARNLKKFFLPSEINHETSQSEDFNFEIPVSNGFYESLNCDVIHFPYQDYVHCRVPTVFNPHDLQHLHFPEFFSQTEIQKRKVIYPAACSAAHTIVTASEFVKQDLIRSYGIEQDKIQVVPWSLPKIKFEEFTENDIAALLKKYDCPNQPFMLYPAMTWEHKNHIRLLEAIALLRDRDNLHINLICTGHKNSFYSEIEKKIIELNLKKQIQFTNVVEYRELGVFYRFAQFVIIPTLFEAVSGPMFEAWQHEAPVACSTVTALPEQAGNAALLFNPFSVEEIAGAIKIMSIDADLRENLRIKGNRRMQDFSLEAMVSGYRSVYRKTAGLFDDAESV